MATDTQQGEVGAELEAARAALPDRFQRRPIIETIHPQTLALIRTRVNAASKVKVSDDELAAFLELAAEYKLDPLTGEVWLVKSGTDKVLLMVGRDGLRKVALNNGFRMVCDVVRANDEFHVMVKDGQHEVVQGYGKPGDRGAIVGAWAIALDTHDTERGFYMAPIDEWKPTNEQKLKYSPWGSQESVMILAAAERQALRQATPLSGLVAQGELDRGEEVAEGLPSREEEDERLNAVATQFAPTTCRAILRMVDRARELGHAGLSDIGTLEMRLLNQDEYTATEWLLEANEELVAYEKAAARAEPPEAEVVGDQKADAERAQALRDEANSLLDQAQELREEAGDEDGAADLEAEADAKREEAEKLAPEPNDDEPSL